jgi:alanine dehydrogenase
MGTSSSGQGHETLVSTVIGEVLERDPADIRVVRADSLQALPSNSPVGSRMAIMLGGAAAGAARKIRDTLIEIAAHNLGCTLEAIEDDQGRAPVLTSMSEIAGGLAVIFGAGLLLNEFGGKGILLGGAPAVPPAHFVVLGAGVLGCSAARAALGAGASVTMLDRSVDRLRAALRDVGPVTTLVSTRPNIEKALSFADLVLGAVAVHGQRAPLLVTRRMLALMKPRSVVMDLAIDMGGCFETSRPTAFPSPAYELDGILHFCVPNLPSAAARSATLALTNASLPYLQEVADRGLEAALDSFPELRRGTYLYRGRCVKESLARAFHLACEPLPAAGA